MRNLSSASGVAVNNGNYFIVGDDTPWLYELDSDLNIIKKIQIAKTAYTQSGRVPKKLKSDFESMEIITDDNSKKLIIISSGSTITTRDTAFIVDLSNSERIVSASLRPLYNKIKLKANFPTANEINIEGVTFSDKNTYLLHRGNVSENIIIELDREAFIEYIKHPNRIPDFNIYSFDLPKHKGVSSGFSGACINYDSSGLLFTASMEDTKDEVNDGKVLGSFVGFIPFGGLEKGEFVSSLLMSGSTPLVKKLEGISISSVTQNNNIQVITVCDNDNGTSDIITFKIILE